jgi:hypothetical protein
MRGSELQLEVFRNRRLRFGRSSPKFRVKVLCRTPQLVSLLVRPAPKYRSANRLTLSFPTMTRALLQRRRLVN